MNRHALSKVPLGREMLNQLFLRLFLPTLVLIVLTLASIGLVWQRTLSRQQVKLSRSIANTVATFTDSAKRVLDALGQTIETADPDNWNRFLVATHSAYSYFDTLYVVDANGRLKQMMPVDNQYQGLDLTRQPYYLHARRQDAIFVSAPFISMRSGKPTVYLAKSIHSGEMVAAELNLGTLQTAINAAIGDDRENVVFVADRAGSLLAHSNSQLVYEQDSVGHLEIVRRGLATESTMAYRTSNGWVYGAGTPLESLDWVVVSQQSLQSALNPLVRVVAPALSISFVLWLWVLWALRRQQIKRVVAPLGRLADTAQRIAAGNLEERARTEEGKEIGELAAAFNHMTQRLRKHIEAENLIAGISRRLMETRSDALDEEISRSLGAIGGFVSADRSYLFLISDDGGTLSNTHEWCAEDIEPFIDDLQNLSVADYPWLLGMAERGADIIIPDVSACGQTSATEKADWLRQGIQSLICVPILSRGSLKGFVGFDAVKRQRNWSSRDAKLLHLAGEIFYIAIQHKWSETALRVSEARFRTLVENAVDAIFLSDMKGNLVDVNRKACESLGYARDELLGLHVTKVDTRFDSQEALERAWADLAPNQSLSIESEHRRKDGSVFPVMVRIGLLEIENQHFILGLAHDITERRQMEVELRESEARYRQLVRHAPAGIYEIDLQGMRFISVNDVMCTYTGYSEGEFLALHPQALLTEESLAAFIQRLEGLTPENPTPPPAEYCVKGKDGLLFWVLINSHFEFENQTPVKATAVAHDLTALRKAEAEKRQLEARLAQAQKMESLGTLAGGIAHDFNNLLMGIQGNASLMLLGEDRSRDDRERLTGIETFVQRGVELTRQLLGLARGGKYEVKATDPNRLVDESATMFGRTKKEIRIHRKYQADIWNIECDRGQIHQVLLNIFVNAWQAMPSGGDLTISTANAILDDATVEPHGAMAGRYVKITITDSGTGMDTETIKRIFDPFFTTKERQRGTGLGLASAYGIVKNHDGIIDVTSRLGEGTAFTIYLPAVDKALDDETETTSQLLKGSERVLIVDDETVILKVAQEMLENLGYQVLSARSGDEAVDLYRRTEGIDVVVLDMIMPDMGGAETFNQLKQIDPNVRVLLSSGYSIDGQAKEIMEQGCRGFIQKPFSILELSRKIRQVLAR